MSFDPPLVAVGARIPTELIDFDPAQFLTSFGDCPVPQPFYGKDEVMPEGVGLACVGGSDYPGWITNPLEKKLGAGLFLLTFLGQNHAYLVMKAAIWIKRLGFWGFLFFLVKGLLWLIVPALVALWATN